MAQHEQKVAEAKTEHAKSLLITVQKRAPGQAVSQADSQLIIDVYSAHLHHLKKASAAITATVEQLDFSRPTVEKVLKWWDATNEYYFTGREVEETEIKGEPDDE